MRYLENYTEVDDFNCTIDYDGVKFYANSSQLWRDGEEPPHCNKSQSVQLCGWITDIDVPVATNLLSMKEIDALKEGDQLARHSNAAPITVISTKEAPNRWRLRDDRDNTYFNCDRQQMTFYGWRSA